MLAYELKTRRLGVLVGQTTAGALLPATFAKVGSDSVLMYPAFSLGKHSDAIEGKGVAPDIEVESPVPFSAGADPIRDAGMLLVVRATPGSAHPIAAALDRTRWPEIVGSVAGDDTVFIACADRGAVHRLRERLTGMARQT